MTNAALTDSTAAERAVDEFLDRLPVPYIEIDARGVITRANGAALGGFQIDRDQLVGNSAWDFVPRDESQSNLNAYFADLHSGANPAPVRRSVYGRRGEFRVWDMFRSRIVDGEGRAAGMRYVAIDVTEPLAAHEEAQRARLWLESVLGSIADPLIVADALGLVRYLNPAALSLTGWAAEEVIGTVIEDVVPILAYQPADENEFTYRAQLERQCRGTATILDRKRYQLRVEVVTTPMVNQEAGVIEGTVILLRRLSDAG